MFRYDVPSSVSWHFEFPQVGWLRDGKTWCEPCGVKEYGEDRLKIFGYLADDGYPSMAIYSDNWLVVKKPCAGCGKPLSGIFEGMKRCKPIPGRPWAVKTSGE